MNEIMNMYNHQLYETLKEKINWYIHVKNNNQTNSIYILIIDGNIKFEYGVFDLDSKILNGTFNLQQEVNGIIKGYTKHILSQYLK